MLSGIAYGPPCHTRPERPARTVQSRNNSTRPKCMKTYLGRHFLAVGFIIGCLAALTASLIYLRFSEGHPVQLLFCDAMSKKAFQRSRTLPSPRRLPG
jgi:hypothetical protein